MNANEWPLVVFTLSVQISVGIILLYDLFLLVPVRVKKERLPLRFQGILLIAATLALTGVIFSLFHLGSPLNALKTLSNLSHSWLSREILAVLVYTGMVVIITILQFRLPSSVGRYKFLIDLTAVCGVILVYVMSRIYMIPAVPAWNSIFTPLGFFLTTLIAGSAILLLFQLNKGSWASQKALAGLIISLPVIQLVLLPVHMSWLDEAGDATRTSLNILLQDYLIAFYIRLGLQILTAAFGFWAFFAIRSDTLQQRQLVIPAVIAFLTTTGSIIIDRFLFYQQMVPVGNL